MNKIRGSNNYSVRFLLTVIRWLLDNYRERESVGV